jgi:hypothetical protein
MKHVGSFIGMGANAALALIAAIGFPGVVLVPAAFFVGWVFVWLKETRP